jgi:hypothetical protein
MTTESIQRSGPQRANDGSFARFQKNVKNFKFYREIKTGIKCPKYIYVLPSRIVMTDRLRFVTRLRMYLDFLADLQIMPNFNNQESEEASNAPGSHLIDLADGWKFWRTLCVRGTGFPVKMLEKLAAPTAVTAIDNFIDLKDAYDDARHRALAQCSLLLKGSDDATRKPLRRARQQISKGRTPDPLPEFPEMKPLLDAFNLAREAMGTAGDAADKSVTEALSGISEALRDVSRDARFREAITWQNRKALRGSVDALLRMPAGKRNSEARQREQLILNYLQRYCAKNETIGFFGPLGWGKWTDEGPAMTQRPGKDLVTARRVHFEYWTIDSLVDVLSKDQALRQWLPPRLHPKIRIENSILIDAIGVNHSIPLDSLKVLVACNGETPAREISVDLVSDPDCGLQTADQVYKFLDEAAHMELVNWTLEVPVGPNPERNLRKTLESIGDVELRARLTGPLDKLEAARDAVADAAGNADALNTALAELEALFTQLTGKSPYQHPGQVYAGRTLVYEDCRRQPELSIGPEIREQIGPPLALILQSARWYSHRISVLFEDHLSQLYSELQVQYAPQPVPASALESLFDPQNPVLPGIVEKVVAELTARWAAILAFDQNARRHNLATDDLRAQVTAAFASPGPGWSGARHHSPDILIAANGPEDLQSGKFQCVLGEIHVTDTMVTRPMFHETHPNPEDLMEDYQSDVDQSRIFRVTPRIYRGHRKLWDPFLSGDFQLAWDNSPPWRSPDNVLRTSDLICERTADGLVVRTHDNANRFPAMIYFERLLWRESFTNFKLLPSAPHTPRIVVDNLVINRESWRFPCRDLSFLFEKTDTERFIGARCWVRDQGLPHWVFARFPQEYKPVYVDLESPASVEVMAKLARRAVEFAGDKAVLSLSEMLPDPSQSWLIDAQGDAYTSELRLVAVDPQSWRAPTSAP